MNRSLKPYQGQDIRNIALVGHAHCGKTTLLRIIAGHDQPTHGQVLLKQKDITRALAYDRPIHTVFQRYALFPHMNVFDNVPFGLRCQKCPSSETALQYSGACKS